MSEGKIEIPRAQAYANAVRKAIETALRNLDEELGWFEQTTHAKLHLGKDSLDEIMKSLDRAYRNPTSFTVSDLSQSIGWFLETCPVVQPK